MIRVTIPCHPSKQIDFVGLVPAGRDRYRCKYPALLVEWLKKMGLAEGKAIGNNELARLSRAGDTIVVHRSGAVRVLRAGLGESGANRSLESLIKRQGGVFHAASVHRLLTSPEG